MSLGQQIPMIPGFDPQMPMPQPPMGLPMPMPMPLLPPQQALNQSQANGAGKERIAFKFEPFLRRQFGFGLDPDRPICEFFKESGTCPNGSNCPNKHPSKVFDHNIVCKYWLRGLCKMGDDCDFLHEYDLSKMPECAYFKQTGSCVQDTECTFLHVDPQSRIPECLNYSQLGFCPDGPKCANRHIRKVICPLYLYGFCPKGPMCELTHAKFNPSMIRGRFKIKTDDEILLAKRVRLEKEKKKREAEAEAEALASGVADDTPSNQEES